MSGLALNNVTKEFGTFTAVNNVELTVPHGTVCLHARTVRMRQDHAAQDDRRP